MMAKGLARGMPTGVTMAGSGASTSLWAAILTTRIRAGRSPSFVGGALEQQLVKNFHYNSSVPYSQRPALYNPARQEHQKQTRQYQNDRIGDGPLDYHNHPFPEQDKTY